MVAQRAADGGRVRWYAARRRGVQVFVFMTCPPAQAFEKKSARAPFKARTPIHFRAIIPSARHARYSRDGTDLYGTPGQGFARADHNQFMDSVISAAVS
jgi:hypothetical protein